MRATKLTTAPQGFEYYRVCDQEGVCRVVRGMWAAQHLVEETPGGFLNEVLCCPHTSDDAAYTFLVADPVVLEALRSGGEFGCSHVRYPC